MCLQNFRRFGNFAGEIWRFEWKAKKMMRHARKSHFHIFGLFWKGLEYFETDYRFGFLDTDFLYLEKISD
jgi:hypothetical protein